MPVNMKHKVYEQLTQTKLLPLYTATDLSYLTKVEEILLENKVPTIEVTFRSELAAEAIKQLSASGKLMVGAGTVRTLAEAKIAIENGAQFVVSPAVVPDVIEYCLEQDVPVFPGTATPRDIQLAADYGINVVKFFPADIYGGLKAINALSGPFYDIKFLPTGGINEENFVEYLENPHVLGVGGSFILSEKIIKEDNGVKMNQILKSLVEQIQ
ncbi:bifunctional 4-hydroxy-2-oxoglutarate aldolase/2-dehydro-3-deoxy-phosphogluconate aldolase [Enterococcus hulanensis]|uniref:Bifunctional 4-hydroxy-2-oxoglutarate aldolase/2-dehydro-3-deoxy-phosphogluconate aldolase n=1 Tax=Enterococcus hulanensis TaxID=2559929 RepID=A0ABU3F2D1_9ENTE|nr:MULTISPECIES: bifunctional 4-hydroxy-2-oxoglutarate aldolase/2-dehydro-3-deoxy-phosphogluconate aldolase [Enterococcus]MBO0411553.1 bifunctional 4-hydroxy-2-oxoglutarate aldolase/2-dehydro-3-deoxy-phosphogluconate aldolase [Enterococcus hulanensis]MDT2601280.1 bifunctional 4-hydroxy-2-oxoglutarate aldolase/2-dehydro-3-deoxy-phosphogluconate aldolase [Enterococcus hulanensis]MDT2610810.1 bifunctional 4-hydroxy-2-oxoglutarate aldolase/2-dehydro-3-deoxy-phosphogluconate aldolase [Enterococcus hu